MTFFVKLLAGLSIVLTAVLATPTVADHQVVVYWGQNGGGLLENNNLTAYCNSTAGIDIVVLAFLYNFGDGKDIPSGTIGQSCYIAESGEAQQCNELANAIQFCQNAGVKIILSLGGAVGDYGVGSQEEAEAIGQNLWNAYGNSGNSTYPRPLGDVFVNGWDFDIEMNPNGNTYYQYIIATLRSNFASDPDNTYYITGAPQCPIPEPNMGMIIQQSRFDYLWIQFYNNPACSVDSHINFDDWKNAITGTLSADARLFIGVPGSIVGATGTISGARYYLSPSNLSNLVDQYRNDSFFGGIMTWDAGFSDSNVNNGCTYAQEARNILRNGLPC